MAANLQRRGIVNLGKRFVYQISYSTTISARRAVHVSAYDKNLEEHVHSSVVPDEVIQGQSAKFWAPHPQTGVFGPATDHSAGVERGFHSSPASAREDPSLEEKAFFRSLENLEKPQL